MNKLFKNIFYNAQLTLVSFPLGGLKATWPVDFLADDYFYFITMIFL